MHQFNNNLTNQLITDFKHLLEILCESKCYDIGLQMVSVLQDRDKKQNLNPEHSVELDNIAHNFIIKFKADASHYT